jgi:hypothetical protein
LGVPKFGDSMHFGGTTKWLAAASYNKNLGCPSPLRRNKLVSAVGCNRIFRGSHGDGACATTVPLDTLYIFTVPNMVRADKIVAIHDKFYVSGICINNTETKEGCSMDGDVSTQGFPLSAFSCIISLQPSLCCVNKPRLFVAGECYYHVCVNRVAR